MPSDHIIRRISESARFTKRNTRLRRTFITGVAVLATLTAATLWSANRALKSAKEAVRNEARANQQAALAERNAANAKTQEAIAVERAVEAQHQQELAEQRRAEALRQAKMAESRKLAAEATSALDREPERALQLAVQSIRASDNESSRDAIVRSLAQTRWIGAVVPRRFSGVSAAAFSPDGSLLAFADFPCIKRVTVLELALMKPTLVQPEDRIARPAICVAAVGYSRLAFAAGNSHLLAHDFSGTDVFPFSGDVRRVEGAHAINPRQQHLAVLADAGATVVFRDMARRLERVIPLDGETARQLFFTSDGRRLIAVTSRNLLVWNIAEQFRRWRFDQGGVTSKATRGRRTWGR